MWPCLLSLLLLLSALWAQSVNASGLPPPEIWCNHLPMDIATTYSICEGKIGLAGNDDEGSATFRSQPRMIATTPPPSTAALLSIDETVPLSETLFEGDMLGIDINLATTENDQNNALKDQDKWWPGGIVPYRFSAAIEDADKRTILAAMQVFHDNTCVKFIPHEIRDADYLDFSPPVVKVTGESACSSLVGRQKGRQFVYISPTLCQPGSIEHELMHALGFLHEQSRSDRDQYVVVNFDNIAPYLVSMFRIWTDAEATHFGLPYDFASVMHYQKGAFSKEPGGWTIHPLPQYAQFEDVMGQRVKLSDLDIQKINAMHNCTKAGPCPDDPAWMKINNKCYFLSFLDDTETMMTHIHAKYRCSMQYKAELATFNRTARQQIQDIMQDNTEQLGDEQNVWISGGRALGLTGPARRGTAYFKKYPFLCSKPFADVEQKSLSNDNSA